MELRHLRYFVILAEELHFARAAERLAISPPTLTVQIQEIERTLSAQLLKRTKRSVALTSAGEVFLVEARRVLQQFATAENVGRRAGRGELGRVEIGYVGSAAYTGLLQAQMSQFSGDYPDVHVNAREFEMEKLPKLIADGEVDIGFVRLPMTLPASLEHHVLIRDHFCLARPAAQTDSPEEAVAPADLAAAAFVLPEQAFGTFQVASLGGFTPRIVSRPGSLLAVLTQVSIGRGVAVIPSTLRAVVTLPAVAFHTLSGEPIISEIAALFRSDENAPTARNFITQLRKLETRSVS
ncbi:LysR substrate-binding domain-containing protein [Acetobacter orleanensis]|uniref:LysR family transcriptional regulator n=1 Tax=Acetobacter orleanensis TaxID=104099 RepID=A0A4Y3TNW2_9PROT|nr:LysR substrate-binding domain-containing protein [Acetobacter orleanensis]KXV64635.1 LysR family transcriptional regulator [Acetobacter orleanensis]PCD78979.1 LysR family transcriptional regulator [Acetobacter orleanensis]GAN67792.1 transcriptional regulator LysR [Acetobacter orleanensis JCM 7639]GBR27945.1 transcriptional regulator LysR [Acetobacter orleanensis NRIC 0473]GEB83129.1 LysR family transcriptional regulator [Acetobacter orleanensis]